MKLLNVQDFGPGEYYLEVKVSMVHFPFSIETDRKLYSVHEWTQFQSPT